jgi:hypothetical protein
VRTSGHLLSLLLCSCGGPGVPVELGDLPRVSVTQALASPRGKDTAAVLFYDPSDCFSCGTPLGQWLDWARRPGHEVRVYLTRLPTNREWSQMASLRIGFAGAVKDKFSARETPRVYLAAGGEVLDSAVGYPAQNRLLTKHRISGNSVQR